MSSYSPGCACWCFAISSSIIATTLSRDLIALAYGVNGIATGTVANALRMSATSSLSSSALSWDSTLA